VNRSCCWKRKGTQDEENEEQEDKEGTGQRIGRERGEWKAKKNRSATVQEQHRAGLR